MRALAHSLTHSLTLSCSRAADTPLNSGEVVRGSLNSFTWHYYHVQVPYGTSALNITAHQTSRYGDVDVYVQRDRFPTERDYAARDVGTDPDIYLQLPNPAPGRWYIGMYGYWHVDYTLQVDIIGTRQTRLMFTHARKRTRSSITHLVLASISRLPSRLRREWSMQRP